jgi:hypothetical protein
MHEGLPSRALWSSARKAMPYFREQRKRVTLVLLLGLLGAALAALEPLILKQLFDSWLMRRRPGAPGSRSQRSRSRCSAASCWARGSTG